ncbi:MAG: glycosyltransferase [Akkermansiaceae bacterium]|jgi:glycosyltransferase involved in cell wall biosynthesis|nr:glycosyltransferase [Akkermansiaceae bacterium]MDP4721659.1 glycosyltransferase [Akkermansiaceae bacterium]MDP4778831.1 glycosyltransferase [Akkermansiaceae bacterium]MDP4846968.1 glycosyltransferase [Akkermansiaceae bacterium]MDP4997028.1 glycosyltransferase [Akkermansiaceae bacterium]
MIQFSIVTPSYNYGQFIGDCMGSVAAQNGVTFEHLVFDAQSTDNTLEVLAQFPHAQVVSEPDRGMCDGINKGFDRCKGEWVMWLNSDDRLQPGALETVASFAKRNPEVDVIFGCWNFIDDGGKFIRTMTLFPHNRRMMLYLGCYIGSTATFFRRSTVIEKGERLSLDFRYVMDGEFYARLAAKNFKFCYLPKVLADFRLHGSNLSMKNYKARNAEECLQLQKQFGETRAYRRAYGHSTFKDENLNALLDSLLYLFYRSLKPILKLLNRHRLKK